MFTAVPELSKTALKNLLFLQEHMATSVQDRLHMQHCQAEFCLVQHVLFLKTEMCFFKRTDLIPKHRMTSYHKLIVCNIITWMIHLSSFSLHMIFIWSKGKKERKKKGINACWIFRQAVMTFPNEIYIYMFPRRFIQLRKRISITKVNITFLEKMTPKEGKGKGR